ncbi:MAG: creatininase family protein [Gemmatimonadota bacterium]|nr:creatininase family protein [Gemmatimonadota bacterium]
MPEEIRLERMTSPEVASAIDDGWTTVIVAAGAVEQHGPHLPMFMDAEHGDRLGPEIARRLESALVAPTIRVGCSEHHMAFRGTVSLEQDTFLAVCRDYCASLSRHGFQQICFIPTHGGNFKPLQEGMPALNEAAGERCSVLAYTDLMEVIATWRAVAENATGLGDRVGGHADIAETAVMLAMHPTLVREDLATAGVLPDPDPVASAALVERIIADGFASVTPNGILGDARGATAALGEALIDSLADVMAKRLREQAQELL